MMNLYSAIKSSIVPSIEKSDLASNSSLKAGQKEDEWIVVGSEPVFTVELSKGIRISGWYMVELNISSDCSHTQSQMQLLYNDKSCESDTITVQQRSGQLSKRLCYIQKNLTSLSFIPPNDSKTFSITHFRITKVSKHFATNRMLKKLSNNHPNYRNKSPKLISSEIKIRAHPNKAAYIEKLYDTYNCLFSNIINPINYEDWLYHYDTNNTLNDAEIASSVNSLKFKPTISVVLPTYNSNEQLLKKCIDSVLSQSYPYWELCIADDASTNKQVHTIINEYIDSDSRIRLTLRDKNGHISDATNSAISLVTGEFIAFLDHDDELSQDALFHITESLNKHPSAKIIYSDEDKIDLKGHRSCPHMKPDWNPDLLLSQNYISHLCVIKSSLVREAGYLRKGVEGAQDYDLLLRCISRTKDAEIIHVPKILYHWRITESSTAYSSESKDYTSAAGVKALKDHLKRTGSGIDAMLGALPNTYTITYPIPSPEPLVSIIIPTRDNIKTLKTCITSVIETTTYSNYEILILDNQSKEDDTLNYLNMIKGQENIRVLPYAKPFNYSAINNFGVHNAKGRIVCLLNDDTEVITPNWLTVMVSHSLRPGMGCVGAKLFYTNGQIQHSGVLLGIGGVAGHAHKYAEGHEYGYFGRLFLTQNYSAVTGACLVVKKSIYEEVNGLNESDLPISFNDIDFCLKVRQAGYRNLWTPLAELYHHESISRGFDDTPEKQERAAREASYMKEKWGEVLTHDPAYNKNLTLLREDFSLANYEHVQ